MDLVRKGNIKKLSIRRLYRPIDNSSARCLNDNTNHYLAGTVYSSSTQVEIVLGPYDKTYPPNHRYHEGDRFHRFVIVRDTQGRLHEVMYHEGGDL